MSRPQQYDVFRPGALPSASLGRRPPPPSGPGALLEEKVDSASELDKVYDGWNVRIDKEVQAMAGGLRELVALADLGEAPTPNTHTLAALHLQLKTSSLIRAAQTLRDTAHELRLALALGDDIAAAGRRDAEAVGARREVDALRGKVALEFGNMVAKVPIGEGEGEGREEGREAGEGEGEGAGHGGISERVSGGAEGDKAPKEAAKATTVPEPEAEGMDVDDEEDEFEEV